jgi:hypothetical protein
MNSRSYTGLNYDKKSRSFNLRLFEIRKIISFNSKTADGRPLTSAQPRALLPQDGMRYEYGGQGLKSFLK